MIWWTSQHQPLPLSKPPFMSLPCLQKPGESHHSQASRLPPSTLPDGAPPLTRGLELCFHSFSWQMVQQMFLRGLWWLEDWFPGLLGCEHSILKSMSCGLYPYVSLKETLHLFGRGYISVWNYFGNSLHSCFQIREGNIKHWKTAFNKIQSPKVRYLHHKAMLWRSSQIFSIRNSSKWTISVSWWKVRWFINTDFEFWAWSSICLHTSTCGWY